MLQKYRLKIGGGKFQTSELQLLELGGLEFTSPFIPNIYDRPLRTGKIILKFPAFCQLNEKYIEREIQSNVTIHSN